MSTCRRSSIAGLAISIASTVVLLRALTDRHELETCFALIAQGALRPQVAATFPLEEAAKAIAAKPEAKRQVEKPSKATIASAAPPAAR